MLTNGYKPAYGYGSSTYVEHAARMYAGQKHSVKIFVNSTQQESMENPEPGITVFRYYDKSHELAQYMNVYLALSYVLAQEILKQLQKEIPDLIEVQDCMALGYYLLKYKSIGHPLLKDVPIVVHAHTPRFMLVEANDESVYAYNNYLIRQCEIESYRLADAILCPSQFLKEKLKSYIKDKTITVIPLPFEYRKQLPVVEEYAYDALYVGRMEYRKGITALLTAVDQAFWQKKKSFKLAIMGDDLFYEQKNCSMLTHLRQKYYHALQSEQLFILPQLPQNIAYQQMRQARSVVIPSFFDNFPVTCIEAMALGKLVIASDQGGQKELIGENNLNGIVYPAWDTSALMKTLTMAQTLSSEQLLQYGNNAQARVREYCGYAQVLAQRLKFFPTIVSTGWYVNKLINEQTPLAKVAGPLTEQHIAQEVYKDVQTAKTASAKQSILGNQSRMIVDQMLSLIVVTVNPQEDFLDDLQTMLDSSYTKKEIIVIDAGSWEPKSKVLIKELQKKSLSGIRVISLYESNVSRACNFGARVAQGEYVAILRDHERVQPSFFERAISVLQANKAIAYCYSWLAITGLYTHLIPTQDAELPGLLYENTVSPIVVMRRDMYLNFGMKNEYYNDGTEDHLAWIRLAENGYHGVVIPEALSSINIIEESQIYKKGSLSSVYESSPDLIKKYFKDIFGLFQANDKFDLLLN
jgi:glycosyltransferase involved in cell wall biosynthesis